MRIGLGQFNATVGDLAGNAARMCEFYDRAIAAGCDLVVFPELAICGYPPEDLLHKGHFLEDCLAAVKKVAHHCKQKTVILGYPAQRRQKIYNSAAVIENGKITECYRKGLLPNYGVFDEKRYFDKGDKPVFITVKNIRIAVTICADIWNIAWLRTFLGPKSCDLIVNISASPFHIGKIATREQVVCECAQEMNSAVCYCNLIGGQDELIFDGRSIMADSSGQTVIKANAFEEDLLVADISGKNPDVSISPQRKSQPEPADPMEEIYRALILGTRDYTRKNGFEKVLIGLSGGIDSSVVAAISAEALGKDNVIGITMPTQFNSPDTQNDAKILAERLGIIFHSIPIESTLATFDSTLSTVPGWDNQGIAYENLQARIRGTLLMSLSNQFGALVLTTGNKSETAVGYSTLYGDTAGGFAVIKDIPKTVVYQLARYINEIRQNQIIPEAVITRPPSAELKPDQKDSDSLPDYAVLDEILKGYVEQDKSARELIESGMDAEMVKKVVRLVDKNEYKRRQCPPGIKITPKAFGKDRRLPMTNRYSG